MILDPAGITAHSRGTSVAIPPERKIDKPVVDPSGVALLRELKKAISSRVARRNGIERTNVDANFSVRPRWGRRRIERGLTFRGYR